MRAAKSSVYAKGDPSAVKSRLVTLILLLLTLVLPACAQKRIEVGDFSLVPAAGWTPQTEGLKQGLVVVVFAPERIKGFTSNLNVMVNNVPPGTKVSDVLDANRASLVKDGAQIYTMTRISIGGREGGRIIWSNKVQGQELKFDSTFIIANNHLYLLTGTAPLARFDDYATAYRSMASSVRIR